MKLRLISDVLTFHTNMFSKHQQYFSCKCAFKMGSEQIPSKRKTFVALWFKQSEMAMIQLSCECDILSYPHANAVNSYLMGSDPVSGFPSFRNYA